MVLLAVGDGRVVAGFFVGDRVGVGRMVVRSCDGEGVGVGRGRVVLGVIGGVRVVFLGATVFLCLAVVVADGDGSLEPADALLFHHAHHLNAAQTCVCAKWRSTVLPTQASTAFSGLRRTVGETT
ncbi:hypothetical protein [Nonomuraea sp. NPDC049784]|uniref:hypothetical protein n=1 Tax=Nonomuraea sp. NPDC049784 TaxID=3154361 RepID=UPI0033FE64BC